MSTRAIAVPGGADVAASGEAFIAPEAVRRLCEAVDWDAALPARARTRRWRVARHVKRVADVVLALAALVVLLPLFALVALLVKLTSPGPVLYEWRVLGERGRQFVGYKFRTMVADADAMKPLVEGQNEMSGPVFKMRQDPRVTRVGRVLRKYSLDELPQLWSVVVGDMSLVGPRPVYAEEFAAFAPWQRTKLAVTPGITCLWQVNGRSEIRDFDRWVALDLEYIRAWSLGLDVRILAKTLPAVLGGRGAY
ncbi:MAG: sugar transferase [Longimicrobiales bacterium]